MPKITEKELEQLTEKFVERINQINTYFLGRIGESIKQIGALTPTKAQELAQILKYGGSYEEIVREIAKILDLNYKDVEKVFAQFARKDQQFYKQFYKYRKVPYVPYNENKALQQQVKAFANITKREMKKFTGTKAIGYSLKDREGNVVFTGLKETYNRVLDEAVLNVSQGKQTFDEEMSRIMKEMGESGIKSVDFESGRSVRLDSITRMNVQDALSNLHNELQKQYGEEFGSDGVEISVHMNPAPDHTEVQGRQFSNEEFEKYQDHLEAKDTKGRIYKDDHRAIGEYNCYHYIFSIVLGVSKPEYTDKQLQEIRENNDKGFNFEGKHYTMYEGTQLQRKLETEIRKQKDLQIMARKAGQDDLVGQSQRKITQLTTKYNQLNTVSGLPRKNDRLRVANYRRIKVKR